MWLYESRHPRSRNDIQPNETILLPKLNQEESQKTIFVKSNHQTTKRSDKASSFVRGRKNASSMANFQDFGA